MKRLAKKQTVDSDPGLTAIIELHFRELLNQSADNSHFKSPTVGVEQEFFVFRKGKNGTADILANLDDTQKLFKTLKNNSDWTIFNNSKSAEEKLLTRLSHEHEDGRYSVLKYEYPPHLLEIAFTYFDDLFKLRIEIFKVWKDLEYAAQQCGLRISLQPFIDPPKQDLAAQHAIDPKFITLSESRRGFFHLRDEKVDYKAVDFPSYMAATQIQISIPKWWDDKQLVNRLYALESSILPLLNPSPKLIQKRQGLYNTVFRGLKLLGFPDLANWSISEWVNAICESPLTVESDSELHGCNIRDLWNSGIVNNPILLLPYARDLQIIRPKNFGALEFRGDASAMTADGIFKIAVIRFSTALLAANKLVVIPGNNLSFQESRNQWLAMLRCSKWNDEHCDKAFLILKMLRNELLQRKKGEEIFLEGFFLGACNER